MTARLVVVGDALLDLDLVGTAARLSPDAPVPVVDDAAEHARPGGAALAAALAAVHGDSVTLVTALAADDAAQRLRSLVESAGVDVVATAATGSTPVKQRVRAHGQSLLRLDRGGLVGDIELDADALAAIEAADAVLVSDYGRGVSAGRRMHETLGRLMSDVPIVWDPHPNGSSPPRGTHLVTPNATEAARWTGAAWEGSGLSAAVERATELVQRWHVGAVAVTVGERGAVLSYGDGLPQVFPAPSVSATDACGAGDRFAAAAAVALGSGCTPAEAVHHAVAAASGFVSLGGAAAYLSSTPGSSLPGGGRAADAVELACRTRAVDGAVIATGGCFDLLHAGHIATLRGARRLGDCLIVCLNSDASVRRLKGHGRPLVPVDDRRRVLEALECVDAVAVFEEDTPEEILRKIRPAIWAKGGDYSSARLPEQAVLSEWGGRALALPYVDGRSTTSLVRRARSGDMHTHHEPHPIRKA
jgi:D-beta-D-heptose 7-phosphate kinase / D-beta-D-heptose 1-phosphate adenosyltransferase